MFGRVGAGAILVGMPAIAELDFGWLRMRSRCLARNLALAKDLTPTEDLAQAKDFALAKRLFRPKIVSVATI